MLRTVRSSLVARGSSALAARARTFCAPAETIEVTIAEAEKMTAAALVRIAPR
jgi:hypothetical protein